MTYRELYQNLFNAHVVSPFYLKPLQPPYPKWYDTNAQCEYYAGITGYSIENYTVFKKIVERLIKMGIVRFDDPTVPNVAGNLLPNHTDQGVNGISEGKNKKIKCEVVEVRTPLRRVWKEMVKRGLIMLDSREESEEERNYYEFHNKMGHEIQECVEFRAIVQNMINNKEIEFYEEAKNPREGDICASEEESTRPAVFPYKDSKRVSWNYDCNVTIPGKESLVDASKEDQDRGSYTRSGRRYDTANEKAQPIKGKAPAIEEMKEKAVKSELPVNEPVNEKEANEFLKFLKHSKYNVVEQLCKQPARISVLALLLSSEVHHSALMRVLNETYVANDIFVNKLDRLVSNISADNYIFFNDDEIPPGGKGSTKALHVTTRCKGYTLPGIHLAGAVPLSLHQKLKLVLEGRLITINTEEDIIATVSSTAPYLETDDEEIECSFQPLKFFNAMFIAEGSKILLPKLSKTTRMSLQLMVGKGALPGRRLGRHLEGKVETLRNHSSRAGQARKEAIEERLESLDFNATYEEETGGENFPGICPYILGSVLDNWTAEEILNFEDDQGCNLSPDLLRMVEQDEKQILPYKESVEIVSLGEGQEAKIGTCITMEIKRDLIELLQEFKDVFAWSYQDMPGLDTDIVVHQLSIKEECKPVQEKLRRIRPVVLLKIKEEVRK
ncbi:uncharacterized protein [Gossypium hirsutum]|uniref:Uncharacterized protein n=1 Tax=Gossypium hirsutum TaxID=3635 RepID=A0ABM2YNJ1_GOSHI|nr:uncharacterized protein LOC121205998 [Gossypium hirsutum]